MRARPILSDIPAVSLTALGLALLAHAALKALFFWAPYQHHIALPLEAATHGLVTSVTLAGVISWVLLVGVVLLGAGRLRPVHLGLSARSLRESLPILVGLWVLTQLAQVALGTAAGDATLAATPGGWPAAVGLRLQAIVGSGLLEETLYRGFLLVQLCGLLRLRTDRDQAHTWALVLSSAYFGLNHLPAGLRSGLPLAEALVFVGHSALVGALFAVLFLRTGNLFVAAGAHALINDPIPLVVSAVDPSLVVLVAVAGLMLGWPSLARRFGPHFTVGMVEGQPAL